MSTPPPTTARDLLEAMGGFVALAAFSVAGEGVHRRLHLPVPGTVVGLLLLLAALLLLGGVPRGLRRASALLIRHMNLFFVPAAVGASAYAGLLRDDLWAIAAALVLGTWAALAAAALTFRVVASRTEGEGG